MEKYFNAYRKHIVGHDLTHTIDGSDKPIIYADWTASGRLYQPIERYISDYLGPYVANTHTESTLTGNTMTQAYADAHKIIKAHVNAGEEDILITDGSGMTAVVNKFQRILGLRVPERFKNSEVKSQRDINDVPLVIITHMEHHSNHTSWLACEVTLEVLKAGDDGMPCTQHLEELLNRYKDRKLKIGAFTACSNVTGIKTDYHRMAAIMHQHGGLCFVDFAASAPYIKIDMHPENSDNRLDAIYFSPHKFLGGPGSSGILIFNKSLYSNKIPDNPGGGTVEWTNPWGEYKYFDNIEVREDGGTPGFLQCIKTALAIKLKDDMGIANIAQRESELTSILMDGLDNIPNLMLLEKQQQNRICIISFYMLDLHHNLVVRILNDKFGIQSRGGCSCAGTYGHILLGVSKEMSSRITDKINRGDLSEKPGWVRISLHPTTSNEEAYYIVDAIRQISLFAEEWSHDYKFNPYKGEFYSMADEVQYIGLQDFDAKPKSVKTIQSRPSAIKSPVSTSENG